MGQAVYTAQEGMPNQKPQPEPRPHSYTVNRHTPAYTPTNHVLPLRDEKASVEKYPRASINTREHARVSVDEWRENGN